MEQDMRTFILGHFGSGKTEVAIHIALSLSTRSKRPLLLDLDFITPYYRCRDAVQSLTAVARSLLTPPWTEAYLESRSVM